MKIGITTLFILLLATMGLSQVTQEKVSASFGTQNAFVVEHQGATEKHAEQAWKDFMKPYSKKTKFNRKSNTWETTEAEMPGVSTKDLGVYFKVAEGNGVTRTSVFFDDGSVFIDGQNSPDKIAEIESMLTTYSDMVYTLVVEDELDDQEEVLKDYNKDLDKLKKQNQKLHDDIADYEQKISEAEDNIITNLSEQEASEAQIVEQQGIIEAVKTKLNNIGKNK